MTNSLGNTCITYSESSATQFVQMLVATKHSTEGGAFQAPVLVDPGAGGEYDDFFTVGVGGTERWGDYAGCVVDPDDDTTFWIAHEVVQTAVTGAGNDARWGTTIATLSGSFIPVELSVFTAD
jgi:hypothetical protein